MHDDIRTKDNFDSDLALLGPDLGHKTFFWGFNSAKC